jgi:hypothetical protein
MFYKRTLIEHESKHSVNKRCFPTVAGDKDLEHKHISDVFHVKFPLYSTLQHDMLTDCFDIQ